MRIALVTHYMPPHTGGVEQVAALLARSYADAGHDVTWIACATPLRPGGSIEDRVRHIRIADANLLERRFAMPYPLIGPAGWRAISQVVRDADVAHVHDCLYPTSIAATRQRTPYIVTQHVAMVSFGGGVIDPFLRGAYETVGRAVLRRARHVAFVSESVRDWFTGHVASDLRASLIPNAVDTSLFRLSRGAERDAARAAFKIPRDAAVVLFAGRLVPKKNVRALVESLASSGSHLLVVGDGPEREALTALGDRVTHVARLPHERMPEAFAAADVFALPSVGEGLPLSLIEALASGLPCVVSDDTAFASLAGCDAVIRAPLTALRAAITQALAAPPTTRAIARAWAEKRYGLARFRDAYLSLIAEAAG
jgi:glycosyltransferase involved in cell wall biosynthesis